MTKLDASAHVAIMRPNSEKNSSAAGSEALSGGPTTSDPELGC